MAMKLSQEKSASGWSRVDVNWMVVKCFFFIGNPLVMTVTVCGIENGPFSSLIYLSKVVIFHSFLYVYQRVDRLCSKILYISEIQWLID